MMLLKLPCMQKSPRNLVKMQIQIQSGVGPEIPHFISTWGCWCCWTSNLTWHIQDLAPVKTKNRAWSMVGTGAVSSSLVPGTSQRGSENFLASFSAPSRCSAVWILGDAGASATV